MSSRKYTVTIVLPRGDPITQRMYFPDDNTAGDQLRNLALNLEDGGRVTVDKDGYHREYDTGEVESRSKVRFTLTEELDLPRVIESLKQAAAAGLARAVEEQDPHRSQGKTRVCGAEFSIDPYKIRVIWESVGMTVPYIQVLGPHEATPALSKMTVGDLYWELDLPDPAVAKKLFREILRKSLW